MVKKFSINTSTTIGTVSLKVEDLSELIAFYTDIIGLTVLKETTSYAELGVDSHEPLLILEKIIPREKQQQKAGLYHIAFLLPERKDLGNVLYHLISNKAPIIGASDHGYSEAVYLEDPEGNGIEIYRDKPKTEWDIRSDGTIAGITIAMDADAVLANREDYSTGKLPIGTTIGHIHLSVVDLQAAENFYLNVLGFDLKYHYGSQANFFAAGEYHHYIGTNVWLGGDLLAPDEQDLGLNYFSILVPDEAALKQIKANLSQQNAVLLTDGAQEISLKDSSGIKIKINTK